MKIQKIRHKENDKIFHRKHAINSMFNQGEFTICGLDIVQSSLWFNDFEKSGNEYIGILKDIDCKECLEFISFCKNLK